MSLEEKVAKKLEELTEEEYNEILKKEKNYASWICAIVLLTVFTLYWGIGLCIKPLVLNIVMFTWSLIFSFIIIAFFIQKLKLTNEEIVRKAIYKELEENESGVEEICVKYKEVVLPEGFNCSKIVKLIASKFLLLDIEKENFILQDKEELSRIYKFSEILSFEVYENGESKIKGSVGNALIGAAFFGLGGAIIGSSIGKKIEDKCTQLQLLIKIDNIENPLICVDYVKNSWIKKSNEKYVEMKDNLREVCSVLEYIVNKKVTNNKDSNKKQISQNKTKTDKEKLLELKELLDEGLITEEEYELKRKQILNLV